ncbi:DUF3667 domain-containing protein [Pontibacter sp. SGAir0037]|uniref:DUF3667 domain-containing protein n=1 Tax=Pontibacter sp. SGAir0037 TaxID=2571030 RepID=UPI0010CD04E3|nr:DUF3667 domain-containing protein [Pontibacter sp. SGAir0037]QCR23595.1 hypothetical protein C1N53_15410 [Pontibacter sp. SGAir0037]
MKKHYRTEKNCLNCGTTVPDKFCPNCGQENLELHENFLHLALHSVGHYFHFESKFFNSIIPLLTKPGYLTKEYFAGKRASHLSPVSMYIFISILFFFLFTANTNSNKKDIIEENTASEQAEVKEEIATAKEIIQRQLAEGKVNEKAASYTYTLLDNAEASLDTTKHEHNDAVIVAKPAGKEILNTEAASKAKTDDVEAEVVEEHTFSNSLQAKFRQVMDDDLSSELFKNKLVSHLPKVMFILLPLFALILKLVNWRSSKYYVEHLIYSIHVHSFLFLFGSIMILLSWVLPFLSDWIQFFGMIVVLWYIYRSMRNIYRSTRWRTVYKFFLLFFAYSFLLTISGLIVVIATLYTV